MKLSTRCYIGLLLGLITSAGCSLMSMLRDAPGDSGATFAAHVASRGLVIDRMEGGKSGVLEPSTTPFSGPQFVLYSGGTPTAALWLNGAVTVVRAAPDSAAPAIGRVDASWDERAIRLTLKPEGDGAFSTSMFKRIEGGGPAALGQPADSTLNLRGVYRAELVDGTGQSAGWIRVQFTHGWSAHRIYEGMLPAALNGPLAVAAVARLDAELTAVVNQAMNPYIGN